MEVCGGGWRGVEVGKSEWKVGGGKYEVAGGEWRCLKAGGR